MLNETENQTRLCRAHEALMSARSNENEARIALDEAADRIEELERERLSICDVCDALHDSPRSFLKQMTAWAARVRAANSQLCDSAAQSQKNREATSHE